MLLAGAVFGRLLIGCGAAAVLPASAAAALGGRPTRPRPAFGPGPGSDLLTPRPRPMLSDTCSMHACMPRTLVCGCIHGVL